MLDALNAITHELIMVTHNTCINATSVCDVLRLIAAKRLSVAITLILANARYQKCDLIRELAQSLSIELLYLPPYSPNLHLIERLWKFVKKKNLFSIYYKNSGVFKQTISNLPGAHSHNT